MLQKCKCLIIALSCTLALICTLSLANAATPTTTSASNNDYAIVIDAGSSHTEMHIYHNKGTDKTSGSLPQLTEIETQSMDIGLSKYKNNPSDVVEPLIIFFNAAESTVPANTPVFLMGTAGMRLLTDTQQKAIYQNIIDYINNNTNLQEGYIGTIDGRIEGIYDWVTINYMKHTFSSPSHNDLLGALDMGGASTQITFNVPNGSKDNKHYFSIQIGDQHYCLYTNSFLGLGQNEALKSNNIPACYPTNYQMADGQIGAFNYEDCRTSIAKMLTKRLVSKWVPTNAETHQYLAFSGFYYTEKFFNALEDPKVLPEHVQTVCQKNWETLQKENPKTPEKYLSAYCFNGVYHYELLENAYPHLLTKNLVTPLSKIEGVGIDWPLGVAVHFFDGEARSSASVQTSYFFKNANTNLTID